LNRRGLVSVPSNALTIADSGPPAAAARTEVIACALELRGAEIANADVSDLTVRDQVVERAQRFIERCQGIAIVDLEQIPRFITHGPVSPYHKVEVVNLRQITEGAREICSPALDMRAQSYFKFNVWSHGDRSPALRTSDSGIRGMRPAICRAAM